MLLEFIATISAGVGAAGLMVALRKLTRGSLPKWLVPAAAGLAMLTFTIWSDYSWFTRAQDTLGPDKIVATTVEKQQLWRPWTYFAAVTTQFIALDKARTTIDEATVSTDMYLLSRRGDSAIVPVTFDCLMSRRTDATGDLSEAEWFSMDQDDPILRTACDRLR
ncbi:hypothetical protein [Celeribacter persicus]|uniref:Uncharacterized protein n=1 Tax=Celeribacter persicus TaxID=1651082 RepID=A0A2T5HP23_9RHOB|nr:hypothetical protein [Celeribacter persicus]PTQ73306.1 hypothetical protein C8N42_1055 [Celeribacter persicus]